jgi:cytoskeletal protein RodZ
MAIGLASERGSVGRILRRERELRQLSLEEVAQATRIPVRTLRLLEADDVGELPSDVFVRGFLKAYARTLGLDPEPLLARYGRTSAAPSVPTPISAMAQPERGRRFGVAIAVVILLILFTLALSIVLRPRRRDIPIELSLVSSFETTRRDALRC